jgi:hypothetical protein
MWVRPVGRGDGGLATSIGAKPTVVSSADLLVQREHL